MPTYSHIRLRAARERADLSCDDLAHMIGRTASTVVKYEAGLIVPTAYVLGLIAEACGCPVDDLYDADDPADEVARFGLELRALVDSAPPLTQGQRARLRVLLRGVA